MFKSILSLCIDTRDLPKPTSERALQLQSSNKITNPVLNPRLPSAYVVCVFMNISILKDRLCRLAACHGRILTSSAHVNSASSNLQVSNQSLIRYLQNTLSFIARQRHRGSPLPRRIHKVDHLFAVIFTHRQRLCRRHFLTIHKHLPSLILLIPSSIPLSLSLGFIDMNLTRNLSCLFILLTTCGYMSR